MDHLLQTLDVTSAMATPFLVVDDAVVTSNIESMQAFCDRSKAALLARAVRLPRAVSVAVDSHEVITSLVNAPEMVTVMVELDSEMAWLR